MYLLCMDAHANNSYAWMLTQIIIMHGCLCMDVHSTNISHGCYSGLGNAYNSKGISLVGNGNWLTTEIEVYQIIWIP